MSYIQKFTDSEKAEKVTRHLGLAFNKKLILAVLITLAIPLTVFLSSQQQTTVNHAAAPSEPTSDGYIVVFKDQPLAVSSSALTVGSSKTKPRPSEKSRINIEKQHKIIKTNLLSVLDKKTFTAESNPESSEVKVQAEYENAINGVTVDITEQQAQVLKKNSPYVKAVYPNIIVKEALMDSVPLINANRVWSLRNSNGANITGRNVNIAIIDTGVDYRHPDLGGSIGNQTFNAKVTGGYDFVNDDDDPIDDRGHGTHVAEIAAGNGVLKGVAPEANIIAYKVFDSEGMGTFSTIISAIDGAIETHYDDDPTNDISIINLSVGAYCGTYSSNCGPNDILSQAIDNATAQGIVSVVAAGNYGPGAGTITSPGTARTAITVGSINKSKAISSFSSRGPVTASNGQLIKKPDVVAPGESICSAKYSGSSSSNCLDNKHTFLSGTSMATPHVAGLAALIKQQNPQLSSSDIKYMIIQNATSLGLDENTQGKGMADASKIFDLNSPGPTSSPTKSPNPTVAPPNPTSIPSPVLSLTPTPIPSNLITVTSFQDSFVNEKAPAANYGKLSKIKIGGTPKEIGYLKFDLTPLKGKKIISAKLKLKIPKSDGSGSSNTFNIKKIDTENWSESGVRYTNKPTTGSIIKSFKGKGVGNVIQVDMKRAVAAEAGSKVSWAITTEGTNELLIVSRNASSSRPQLVIEYR